MAKSDLQAYLEQQKQKRLKYPGSTLFRSVQSTVRLVLRSIPKDSPRHQIVSKVLENMYSAKSVTPCSELDQLSHQMLNQARGFMRYMKFAFIEITSKNPAYSKYEDPFMVEYLVDAQNEMEFGNFPENYERELLKLTEHGWTESFVQQWVRKAVEMQENKTELFQKKNPVVQIQNSTTDNSFKRTLSSRSQSETSTGQQPRKKVKKESLSYYVYIMSGKTIIKHMSSEKEKSNFQARLQNFRKNQDSSIFQTLEREIAKQLFELRSYFKNFMESFMEITAKDEYKSYQDRDMANKVLQNFESIDPNNVYECYKNFVLEGRGFAQAWPQEMRRKIFQRAIQMKKAETKLIIERQRQQEIEAN